MFPFWDLVIAPLFDAVEARRVVEIGALRGEHTVLVLERLGPESELHVIDPLPEFDPAEHERQFPGRYLFHRDLSLNALPNIPPVDIALIDGDHNWYTVYHELKLLSATAREAGEALPVMILHDVAWPYGRRDLYYDPDTIPAEHRQPYAQKGLRMDSTSVVEQNGLNPTMYNALEEGGERNGVMTGVDDFVAEYDKPLRVVFLPIYFGLAVVVEEERLAAQPAIAAVLDRLQSADGKEDLLSLAEKTRLDAMLFQHTVFYHRENWIDKLARRYLATLKGALLDEHYIENEVRISHLLDCVQRGSQPVDSMLRDPTRMLKDKTRRIRASREAGLAHADSGELDAFFPFTTMGHARLDHLEQCLDAIRQNQTPGDAVECGTERAGGAIFLRAYFEAWHMPFHRVWVADRFRSAPADAVDDAAVVADDTPPLDAEVAPAGQVDITALQGDLNTVRDGFARFDLLDDRVRFLVGDYAASLPDPSLNRIALLRIGHTAVADAADILEATYDRVVEDGFVIIDDYNVDETLRQAVDEFRSKRGITDPLERIDWSGASWRKTAAADDTPVERDTARPAANAPLAAPMSLKPRDLTVVVVFYNMRREAERTLHSLSRAYQRDIDELDYEVVVVENGSDADQRLGEEFVRSFGPEFRYFDRGDDADPSPVSALNFGIRKGRGDAYALMIDGAHVLTPGVLRYGVAGLESYDRAIVGTQQWYMGPGQQGDVLVDGYDDELEDHLFEEISWPTDGYRLFDIGHFIGDRDWLDGLWESNCLFAPRALLAQAGCFDEAFSMPGGGYANLELYERLGSSPDVTAVTILGEGSFHQSHGGTTTNQPDIAERNQRLANYAKHYADLRGRTFRGLDKQMHYVGAMSWEACRTRARRRVAPNYFRRGAPDDPDGRPTKPTPIPDDLNTEFIDAYWRSFKWRDIEWMGQRPEKAPGDLLAYQELLWQVRPDWVIETNNGGTGGRAVFLASICELLGHGQVLSIDAKERDDRPGHPRVTHLTGSAHEDDVVARVRELTGDTANALVILGTTGGRKRMLLEFEAYKPFVPAESYIVVENTIVNGHPVWASFGIGPHEAVTQILADHREFATDTALEKKYATTFNAGGYLKRVR